MSQKLRNEVFRLRVLAELISDRNFSAADAYSMNQSQLRYAKAELIRILADDKGKVSAARLAREVARQKRDYIMSSE
jgi:hypothetical protein